ncbi:MAG: tetratricopeptide repeat protein [Elusimicrobia bacterium]|nr:tetratricopeptide repeat protein [Elusimicrobiota bacterium]
MKTPKKFFLLLPAAFLPMSLSYGANWKAPTRKGVDEYKKGDYQSAWNSFNQAGNLDPKNPVIQFNKGCAAYKLNDMETASQSFNQSRGLAGKDVKLQAESHYNAGNIYFRQGKMEEAIEAYKKALLLNPRDEEARHNLALAMRQVKPPDNQNNPGGQGGGGGEQNQNDDKNEQDQNQQQQPQMKQQEMESLLQSYEQEQMNQARKMKRKKPQEPTVDNDW